MNNSDQDIRTRLARNERGIRSAAWMRAAKGQAITWMDA